LAIETFLEKYQLAIETFFKKHLLAIETFVYLQRINFEQNE